MSRYDAWKTRTPDDEPEPKSLPDVEPDDWRERAEADICPDDRDWQNVDRASELGE